MICLYRIFTYIKDWTKERQGSYLDSRVLELIATALSIRDGAIHPTIIYEIADPECDLEYNANTMRTIPVTNAMSTSLGFGGFNSAIIISRFE